jgi:hypothetical protein
LCYCYENFEDTKGVIRSPKSKGEKRENTMAKRKRKIQWPKEKGKYNGQKKKENTMAKRKRTNN